MADTASIRQQARVALTVLVYSVTVFLGSALLVPDPSSPLVLLPVLVGAALLVHALHATALDELGYAILALWAAILLLSVGTGLVELFIVDGDVPPLTTISAARVLGTVGLSAILAGTYLFFVRRGPESG